MNGSGIAAPQATVRAGAVVDVAAGYDVFGGDVRPGDTVIREEFTSGDGSCSGPSTTFQQAANDVGLVELGSITRQSGSVDLRVAYRSSGLPDLLTPCQTITWVSAVESVDLVLSWVDDGSDPLAGSDVTVTPPWVLYTFAQFDASLVRPGDTVVREVFPSTDGSCTGTSTTQSQPADSTSTGFVGLGSITGGSQDLRVVYRSAGLPDIVSACRTITVSFPQPEVIAMLSLNSDGSDPLLGQKVRVQPSDVVYIFAMFDATQFQDGDLVVAEFFRSADASCTTPDGTISMPANSSGYALAGSISGDSEYFTDVRVRYRFASGGPDLVSECRTIAAGTPVTEVGLVLSTHIDGSDPLEGAVVQVKSGQPVYIFAAADPALFEDGDQVRAEFFDSQDGSCTGSSSTTAPKPANSSGLSLAADVYDDNPAGSLTDLRVVYLSSSGAPPVASPCRTIQTVPFVGSVDLVLSTNADGSSPIEGRTLTLPLGTAIYPLASFDGQLVDQGDEVILQTFASDDGSCTNVGASITQPAASSGLVAFRSYQNDAPGGFDLRMVYRFADRGPETPEPLTSVCRTVLWSDLVITPPPGPTATPTVTPTTSPTAPAHPTQTPSVAKPTVSPAAGPPTQLPKTGAGSGIGFGTFTALLLGLAACAVAGAAALRRTRSTSRHARS